MIRWVVLGALAVAVIAMTVSLGSYPADEAGPCPFELRTDHYTILEKNTGRELLHTGRIPHEGDAFVDVDNRLYRIKEIEELTALAVYEKTLSFPDFKAQAAAGPVQTGGGQPLIGIYHSHSSESYVPSDGADSIEGEGGILKVGESFAEALEGQGFEVIHSTTSHDPHDAGSYVRSRRTATELRAEDPAALFDVHRDTAPPETYRTEIDGREVAQVLLVVGTQNPRFSENLAFAQRLQSSVEEVHPGLMRGILKSGSDFNQDLFPQSMLLEVGAHQNIREEAEEAVALLAEGIPGALGEEGTPAPGVGRAAWRTLLWLVLAVALGGALYFYLSSGSIEEAVDKARASVDPRVWMKRLRGGPWGKE